MPYVLLKKVLKMKFNLIFILFFITSCSQHLSTLNQKTPYSSKGFAYIYNDQDFKEKVINRKMDNDKMQISHQNLKVGTLLKITNIQNNQSIVLKNQKRIKYPDFYKLLITLPVKEKLNLTNEFPIIEITEIKKNKSFVAEKAKSYKEEKKTPSNAPITSVTISNISKNKDKKPKNKNKKIFIQIASFYSIDTAKFLKQRIIKEVPEFNDKKLTVRKISNKETQVISGPYNSVNLLKNDYIKLKNFGFEELDIYTNE